MLNLLYIPVSKQIICLSYSFFFFFNPSASCLGLCFAVGYSVELVQHLVTIAFLLSTLLRWVNLRALCITWKFIWHVFIIKICLLSCKLSPIMHFLLGLSSFSIIEIWLPDHWHNLHHDMCKEGTKNGFSSVLCIFLYHSLYFMAINTYSFVSQKKNPVNAALFP